MNRSLSAPGWWRLVLLGACACGSDIDPYNRVSSLRVLALQSEPAAPGPLETAALSALVNVPEGESASYEWSWCPFAGEASDGAACLVSEEELRASLPDPGGLPAFDLGPEASATFSHEVAPALLAEWCSLALGGSAAVAAPDCALGFPIQVRLRVSTERDEVIAQRTLALRFAAQHPPNQNPVIDALRAGEDDLSPLAPGEAPATVVPRGAESPIEAPVSAASQESYSRPAASGETEVVSERLVWTWFVEGGETEFQRTSLIDGVIPLEDAQRNTWTPPSIEDYPSEVARLWVVVRDERGGVGWREAAVRLGGQP